MTALSKNLFYLFFIFPFTVLIEIAKAFSGVGKELGKAGKSVAKSATKKQAKGSWHGTKNDWWQPNRNNLDNDIEQLRHVDGMKGL